MSQLTPDLSRAEKLTGRVLLIVSFYELNSWSAPHFTRIDFEVDRLKVF